MGSCWDASGTCPSFSLGLRVSYEPELALILHSLSDSDCSVRLPPKSVSSWGCMGKKALLPDGTAEEKGLEMLLGFLKCLQVQDTGGKRDEYEWVVNEHPASSPVLQHPGWSGKEETCSGPGGDSGTGAHRAAGVGSLVTSHSHLSPKELFSSGLNF